MNMDRFFDIKVSKNHLSASLSLKNEKDLEKTALTPKVLNDWFQMKKIIFGVDQKVVQSICDHPRDLIYPIVIAEGTKPENGMDAYLMNEVRKENESVTSDEDKHFNFRNIRTIPSVKSGQLLATIIPPTPGCPGKDVYGNVIKARPGKQLRLRPGKNIIFQKDKIWATTDGQISISSNSVNVFPVYEVKGDLDLNTGNIDFIGNVTIHGNVPSGYEVKAGGDVKIRGLVEGAIIESQGSIYIAGGIAGQKKAIIKAGGDLHTRYINQADITAGNDIQVDSFIMHSDVVAGNRIFCKKAHIIGGKISAGKSIEAGEIGNQHFAKTELFIGIESELLQQERSTLDEIMNLKENLMKLAILKEKLQERELGAGKLTTAEQQMMEKQRETAVFLIQKQAKLEEELDTIRQQIHQNDYGYLSVYDKIHPNNQVTFSRYSKVIQQPLTNIKLYLNQGEIVSVPL